MADLFGLPEAAPVIGRIKRKPALPFYCYGCAGTHSRKCRYCGERVCARGRNCQTGGCDCRFSPDATTPRGQEG